MGNAGPEGGKDKKKKKHTTEAQVPDQTSGQVQAPDEIPVLAQAPDETPDQDQAAYQEAEVAVSNTSLDLGITHSEAEKLTILKDYFENLDNQFLDYDEKFLRSHDKEVGEKTRKLLDKQVLEAVRKIDPSDVESKEWFSRCPSGYFYTIDGDENRKPLATGTIGQNRGCSRVSLGEFRYDVVAGTVEMKLPQDLGYVDLKNYFKMRKVALG